MFPPQSDFRKCLNCRAGMVVAAILLVGIGTSCTAPVATTVIVGPASGGPPIVDPASNLTGDTTRKFMDILETSIRTEGDYYVLDVLTAGPFPAATDMKGGKRFDFIWFVDIDKNRSTGQTPLGNDYNIHLLLDETGWGARWYKVSPVSEKDGIEIHPDDFRIRVAGARANMIFSKRYLPRETFEMWATCTTANAKDWGPLTENPLTPRASFTFGPH